MDKARLEAFSDGVFAVAITLLALDLAVAGPGHGALGRQLTDRWPSYAAYVVSFFVIGITWVNHHELFKTFARVDRALLFLNLLLLLFIAAIPFATSTMAAYLRTGGADAHLAAGIVEGRLHLLAYALGASASGMTFLDSEIEALLAEPLSGILFTCVGVPEYKSAPGGSPGQPRPIRMVTPRLGE